jgi:hypothetical protein
LAITFAGCARSNPQFIPPGMDRDELAATIAQRGQPLISDGPSEKEPALRQNRLDRSVQVVIEAVPVALVCVAVIPLVFFYAVAPGPHAPINLGNFSSSS